MKQVATDNGIEFAPNATRKKMRELLTAHGIPVAEDEVLNKAKNYDDAPPMVDPDEDGPEMGMEDEDVDYEEESTIVDDEIFEDETVDQAPEPTGALFDKFRSFQKEYRAVFRRKKDPMRATNLTILERKRNKLKDMAQKQDKNTYIKILEWERARNMLGVKEEYFLNGIEYKKLKNTCVCFNAMVSGRKVSLGQTCKYKSYFDEARQDEVYRIYVERTIEPEEQIDRNLERKLKQGFIPDESDYAPPKVVVHSFPLVEEQFERHFKIQ